MPQMSPLWWEILFIYFMMIYTTTSMMIYWQSNKLPNKTETKMNKMNYNWKW